MPHLNTPLVDDQNPCYCPTLSASAFLDRLRVQRGAEPLYIPTFSQLLDGFDPAALDDVKQRDEKDLLGSDEQFLHYKKILDDGYTGTGNLGRYDARKQREKRFYRSTNPPADRRPPARRTTRDPPAAGYTAPRSRPHPRVSDASTASTASTLGSSTSSLSSLTTLSSGDTTSFDALRGAPAFGRSSATLNNSSFDIIPRPSRIGNFLAPGAPSSDTSRGLLPTLPNYEAAAWARIAQPTRIGRDKNQADGGRRIRSLEDELYGPQLGTETPRGLRTLVRRLDALLPGMRLADRLRALGDLSHQAIADLLGSEGLLNGRVLEVFRASEVWRFDLSASLFDELGLNVSGTDTLHVLGRPNSFLCLTELDLSETPLRDFDLTRVHHLPLRTLLLNNTGIGNEAIFHLARMRHSLAHLHLEANARIDDDAVPALLVLSRLRFLTLIDTGLRMPGLRRLARALRDQRRAVDVAIPRACEAYVRKMHTRYEPAPAPPLITDPAAAHALSVAGLRRNLSAHAARNGEIAVGGTHAEMAGRLERILVMREDDLVVRAMMWGEESDGDNDGVGMEAGEEEDVEEEDEESMEYE